MCLNTVFFFNDTATTEIYTLSLHDALPISTLVRHLARVEGFTDDETDTIRILRSKDELEGNSYIELLRGMRASATRPGDRKSTRLNFSHANISYAVFCLKKTAITTFSSDRS